MCSRCTIEKTALASTTTLVGIGNHPSLSLLDALLFSSFSGSMTGFGCFILSTANLTDLLLIVFRLWTFAFDFLSPVLIRALSYAHLRQKRTTFSLFSHLHYCLLNCSVNRDFCVIFKKLGFKALAVNDSTLWTRALHTSLHLDACGIVFFIHSNCKQLATVIGGGALVDHAVLSEWMISHHHQAVAALL